MPLLPCYRTRMPTAEWTLTRDVFHVTTTLGVLRVDGKPFGFVCEDEDRGLDQADPTTWSRKVKAETAVPVGRYRILKTWSPKFQRNVMELQDVPAFRGIRVHQGADESHTEGCLLPGLSRDCNRLEVYVSAKAVKWLDGEYERRTAAGDEVWITIDRAPLAWANYLESQP